MGNSFVFRGSASPVGDYLVAGQTQALNPAAE